MSNSSSWAVKSASRLQRKIEEVIKHIVDEIEQGKSEENY